MGSGKGGEENSLASFTQALARHLTNPANQNGLLPSCSRIEFSGCCRTLQHLSLDRE